VGGNSFTSNQAGHVSVPEAGVGTNPPVDVLAEGYFDRQSTAQRATGRPFSLWPRSGDGGLDERLTALVVYTDSSVVASTGVEEGDVGNRPLRRWGPSYTEIPTYFGAGFEPGMGLAVDLQVQEVENLNAILVRGPRYLPPVFEARTPTAGYVSFAIDPAYPSCEDSSGVAYTWWNGNDELQRVEITYCSLRYAQSRNVVAHELGHSMGFKHSARPLDVMYSGWPGGYSFTTAEAVLVGLMYQRPGGNRFPDIDRGAGGRLSRSGSEAIACRR
jgi:hypothetical protein